MRVGESHRSGRACGVPLFVSVIYILGPAQNARESDNPVPPEPVSLLDVKMAFPLVYYVHVCELERLQRLHGPNIFCLKTGSLNPLYINLNLCYIYIYIGFISE